MENNKIIEDTIEKKFNQLITQIPTIINQNKIKDETDFFNFSLSEIYHNIGKIEYIRIYSWHNFGHNLKNTCKTYGLLSKTMIMSDKILMICYNESYYATNLNNLLNNKSKHHNQNLIIYLITIFLLQILLFFIYLEKLIFY